MSATLRARYRAWYFSRRYFSFDGFEGLDFVGLPLHIWHRMRIRRVYGVQF